MFTVYPTASNRLAEANFPMMKYINVSAKFLSFNRLTHYYMYFGKNLMIILRLTDLWAVQYGLVWVNAETGASDISETSISIMGLLETS